MYSDGVKDTNIKDFKNVLGEPGPNDMSSTILHHRKYTVNTKFRVHT